MTRPVEPLPAPVVPDHQLIRIIGEGGYGQIWLGRNIVGTYRAIKIVYRSRFADARPYDREFKGIQEFEPISRSHPGLVDILQIGRNDEAGYFYYVMELADDDLAGREFHPDSYCAKTLARVWEAQGRIPALDTLRIGMNLAAALAHMHRHELVHRDVKPSNIIFVQGQPKLADIGLVVPVSDAHTFVGTMGYIPPEGPGSIQADVYGLGKVLYEISTGQDRESFPELPHELSSFEDRERIVELNEIVVKACANSPRARYATADEMRSDLEFLLEGRSVKRLRFVERQLARTARVAAVATVLAIAAGILALVISRVRQREQRLLADSIAISGITSFEENNLHASLPFFAEALRLEEDDPGAAASHRLRIGSALERAPRLLQFWKHGAEVKDICFSPDGRSLSVASGRTAYLVDVRSGVTRSTIPTRHTIETAVYSRDGARVAIGHGNYVRVIDAAGADVFEVKLHGKVFAAEFSPDGSLIGIACDRTCAHLLNATNGAVVGTLAGHTDAVIYAAFNSDGTMLVTSGRDGTARVWDVPSRSLRRTIVQSQWVFDASFSPDGRSLVTACTDHFVRLWDATSGHQLPTRMEHRGQIRRARFSPDGRWIVSAALDKTVRFWDALDGSTPISTLNLQSPALHAVFSPDGYRVATASQRGEIQIWDVAPILPLDVGRGVVAANGEHYVTYRSNSFSVWDARSDVAVAGPFALDTQITSVQPSGDARIVAAVGTNEEQMVSVHIYTAGTNTRRLAIPGESKALLSPDGKHLAWFGKSGARVLDTASGREIFTSAERAANAVFSPDSRRLSLAYREKIAVVALPTGRELFNVPGERLKLYSMEFSTNGNRLLIGVSDGKFSAGVARLLDAQTGRAVCTITQHTDGLRSVAFSHRGDFVATGGEDSEYGIWDASTGLPRIDPISLPWPASSIGFSGNDLWLAITTIFELQVFEVRTGRAVTPVLKLPYQSKSGFCAGDNRLWIQIPGRGLLFIDLPSTAKSPDEIIAVAHYLGVSIPTGVEWDHSVLTRDEFQRRCAEEFTRSDRRASAFHRDRVEAAEDARQWFAAMFHLDRLLAEMPNDADLRSRRQSAQANWLAARSRTE